ncbi:MAG TPA: hypothetical protein VIT38_09990 [Allosphingosinicella sp.]|jgi:hypothetical protein
MKALLAISILLTGIPLFAAAAEQGASSEQPRPQRQICRRIPAIAGPGIQRVRVCRTAAEWRARSDISVDDAHDTLGPLFAPQDQPVNGYTSTANGPR